MNKSTKKEIKRHLKAISVAASLTFSEIKAEYSKYKPYKYPQTNAERKEAGLSGFWSGVICATIFNADEIRDMRLSKLI